ncbi:amidohydrolase family protein [Xylophilus sp. GW821-FHT01B05]
MTSRVLDIHPHIITTDTQQYPRDPLGGNQSIWSRDRPTTTDQLLSAMDDAGVAKAAIVQASTCYGFDNSYVADAVAAHPDRFTGVFSVDMLASDAPQRIRHWVDRKLAGLRLFTAGSTMAGQADWLADPRSFPAWDCAAELGIPVCVQMRAAGMPQLQVLLDRYPRVPIVIDHFLNIPLEDGPPYAAADTLMGLARFPNIYLKLTPVIVNNTRKGRATPESFFPRVVSEFGASRIAWGSNYPANAGTLKELLEQTQSALAWAPRSDLDWIFHKTAEGLYPALKADAR